MGGGGTRVLLRNGDSPVRAVELYWSCLPDCRHVRRNWMILKEGGCHADGDWMVIGDSKTGDQSWPVDAGGGTAVLRGATVLLKKKIFLYLDEKSPKFKWIKKLWLETLHPLLMVCEVKYTQGQGLFSLSKSKILKKAKTAYSIRKNYINYTFFIFMSNPSQAPTWVYPEVQG